MGHRKGGRLRGQQEVVFAGSLSKCGLSIYGVPARGREQAVQSLPLQGWHVKVGGWTDKKLTEMPKCRKELWDGPGCGGGSTRGFQEVSLRLSSTG